MATTKHSKDKDGNESISVTHKSGDDTPLVHQPSLQQTKDVATGNKGESSSQ